MEICIMATSYAPNIVTDGLVACWDAAGKRSYPGTGTTWYDLAGGYNGTLENGDDGSLTFDPAKGGSLNFDGTDDYINCGNVTEIDSSSTMSYCMWAKLDAVTGSNTYIAKWKYSSPRQGCFSMQTEDVGGDYELRVFVAINLTEGGGNIIDTADAPLTTNWQYVSVVYDGSLAAASRVAIYVDGVKSATSATLGTIPTSLTSSTADLEIGRWEGLGRYFDGNIASVGFYTRALTAAEVKQNYHATKGRFA